MKRISIRRRNKGLIVGLVLVVLIIIGLGIMMIRGAGVDASSVTIILSPHYDDAVLSLGGMMAEHKRQTIVANFFTDKPAGATTSPWDILGGYTSATDVVKMRAAEDKRALSNLKAQGQNFGYYDHQYISSEDIQEIQSEIAQDIQTLIIAHANKTIYIYGPSEFNSDTHPDHKIVHDAYIDVAKSFPPGNVHFYFYEDFPYIEKYNANATTSLRKLLEDETGFLLNQVEIPLVQTVVNDKISALKKYTSQVKAFNGAGRDIITTSKNYTQKRCGGSACEVVYEIQQF